RRPPPPSRTGCAVPSGLAGDLPDVVRELAGDGDRDGRAALAAGGVEVRPALVQAQLGAPGGVDRARGLSLLASAQGQRDTWRAAVVPGGLDQQPAGVPGSGLGDRAL